MTGWLRGWDIPIAIGRDEARRRALEELSRAKYSTGLPQWLQDLLDRLARLLERVAETYVSLTSSQQAGGFSWGSLIAALLVISAIIVVVWRVGLPRLRRRAGKADVVDLDSTVAASDYRALAEQHAAAEDWRSAVRDRFRALVRELEIRTILDVRPARTAREAAGSAARMLPDCRELLGQAAEDFGGVVYGDRPADAAAYGRMVEVDQTVTAAADKADLAAFEDSVSR